MGAKERIMALKLIEKKRNNELFFDEIGVAATMKMNCNLEKTADKVVTKKEEN